MRLPYSQLILGTAVIGLLCLVGWVHGAEREGADTTAFLPLMTQTNQPDNINFVPVFLENDLLGDVTDVEFTADGRLFIVERPGRIVIIQNGSLVGAFLDLGGMVGGSNWEEGLLGLDFHPDYPNTPYFYVMYTESGPLKRIVVARYTVSGNPHQADPNSALILLQIDKSLEDPDDPTSFSPVHNGGDLTFGPDGYLYVPVGDGGPDPFLGINGDPDNDSQRLDRLLGKVLRIDVDPNGGLPADCGSTANYSIPANNPFVGQSGCDEIWAYGLRNPWRISFDRLTGDLYITDVGEWQMEELNFVPAGSPGGMNFGWNCYEGSLEYRPCNGDFTFPIFEYERTGGCASIIGGHVYRGTAYPKLYGYYLFADYCTGDMWVMKRTLLHDWHVIHYPLVDYNFTTFGEDVNGELYAGRSDYDGVYHVVAP